MVKSVERHAAAFLVVASLLSAMILAELTLRAIAPDKFYVWPPNLQQIFTPSPGIMPGVNGISNFVVNEEGIRGRSFSPDDSLRILAIGGSTTECLYLDQTEAWPYLLEKNINEEYVESPIWVGNAGVSGRTTRHHIVQVEHILKQYPSIDVFILLVGVNDMQMPLRRLPGYQLRENETSVYRQELVDGAFAVHPNSQLPDSDYVFYKRSEIWRLLRKVKNAYLDEDPAQKRKPDSSR